MTDDARIRSLLGAADEGAIDDGVVRLWDTMGPGIGLLIARLLLGDQHERDRRAVLRDIVLALRSNAKLIADAPDIRVAALNLALVELTAYLRERDSEA